MVDIDKITTSDDERFEQIIEQTGVNTDYRARITEMMTRKSLVLFAAKLNDMYVGRVSLWLDEADEEPVRKSFPGTPLVNALEVDKSVRKQGIASLLMEALESEVRLLNKTAVCLGVESDNIPAVNLYEKLGYSHTKLNYESCWNEPDENGEMNCVCVNAELMKKEL